MCIFKACLLGHIVEQNSHWAPPEAVCLASIWYPTVDWYLDWKSQCAQPQSMASSLIMEVLITWFRAAEEYWNYSKSKVFSVTLDWRCDQAHSDCITTEDWRYKSEQERKIIKDLFVISMNMHYQSRFTWTCNITKVTQVLWAHNVFTLNVSLQVAPSGWFVITKSTLPAPIPLSVQIFEEQNTSKNSLYCLCLR